MPQAVPNPKKIGELMCVELNENYDDTFIQTYIEKKNQLFLPIYE